MQPPLKRHASVGRRRDSPNTQPKIPSVVSVRAAGHTSPIKKSRPERDPTEEAFQIVFRLLGAVCLYGALAASITSWSTPLCFASTAVHGAQPGVISMPAWTGLSAGFLHTLAGPDHLAGLTPLTLGKTRLAAATMGALWGFGHSSGQLLLGLAFLLLKERFQGLMPALSKWSGLVAGLTLIAIGLVGIYESRMRGHHKDSHSTETVMQMKDGSIGKRSLGTYAMGFVYGMQPDSLFVVLPALALPTRLATFSYISMFVVGTIGAMAGYTVAIGTATEIATERRPWLMQHLSTFAASVALVIGCLILLPTFGCPSPFG